MMSFIPEPILTIISICLMQPSTSSVSVWMFRRVSPSCSIRSSSVCTTACSKPMSLIETLRSRALSAIVILPNFHAHCHRCNASLVHQRLSLVLHRLTLLQVSAGDLIHTLKLHEQLELR